MLVNKYLSKTRKFAVISLPTDDLWIILLTLRHIFRIACGTRNLLLKRGDDWSYVSDAARGRACRRGDKLYLWCILDSSKLFENMWKHCPLSISSLNSQIVIASFISQFINIYSSIHMKHSNSGLKLLCACRSDIYINQKKDNTYRWLFERIC